MSKFTLSTLKPGNAAREVHEVEADHYKVEGDFVVFRNRSGGVNPVFCIKSEAVYFIKTNE